jgi:arylsulfatase A-like enzyme
LLGGAAAGAAGSLVVGWLDALFAARANADAGAVELALCASGVLAPFGVGLGLAGAAAGFAFCGEGGPKPRALLAWLEKGDAARRNLLSLSLLVAPWLVALYAWVVGRVALVVFSGSGSPARDGVVLALGALLVAVPACLASLGVTRHVTASAALRLPEPVTSALIAVLAFGALFAFAVSFGESSGAGSPYALFGVFKRDELDLRAPAGFAALVSAGFFVHAPLARRGALMVAGAALVVTLGAWSALRGLEARPVRLAIERHAPASRLVISTLRRWSDRDGDGFSAWYGGGDCDDADPRRSPAADDVPGNGVDEDCSGEDARPIDRAAPAATPLSEREWMARKLPKDANVVLITVDTLRYDLGFMGNERPVSPVLDQLAARSTVFERSYALASYTGKSMGPMLIGKYPSETHRDFAHFNRFGQEDTFVQERLSRAGVHTASVQGHWYFFLESYGLGRGFDVVDKRAAPRVYQAEGDRSVNSKELSDAAIELLESEVMKQRRFFLWLHYLDPHAEYVAHDGFDFGRDARARYDGEVAFVDHHVGRVLDALEKSGFSARTAVIVTSDHGEAFGEHGMIRHGRELWDELVRVPLIVHVPGAEPRRVKERRSLVDLVPTLLELFRLPAPSGNGSDFVSGQSLLADVLGPPGHVPQPRPVFVDMSAGPHNAERQALIENDLKLVAQNGRPLGLYDLASDPGEKHDLLDDTERADAMLERFKAFRQSLRLVNVKPTP